MFILGLLGLSAGAAELQKLAVISVLGDSVAVVTHRPEVGSQIDRNQRDAFELAPATVDNIAVGAVADAIKRMGKLGTAQVVLLAAPGGQSGANWFEGDRFTPPAELRAALTATDATHLLLVTRLRASTGLKTSHGSTGSGHLEGLGFYLDHNKKMSRSDTGERGQGFLAVYAYLKLTLIDLSTGAVEREQRVTASRTFSAARNTEGTDPWGALDATQKMAAMRGLIRTELVLTVPKLLAAP